MKNKVLSLNNTVQRRTETLKKTAAYPAQSAGNVIKYVHEKTEDVKRDTKDGICEIEHTIRNTPGHIVNEFDNL